jgi:GxxExxY protein
MCHELARSGLSFHRQVPVALEYDGLKLDCGYRLDLIVQDAVIVEIKSVDRILPIHECQLLTYLRVSRLRVGLLLNFNVTHLRHGLRRKVLQPI